MSIFGVAACSNIADQRPNPVPVDLPYSSNAGTDNSDGNPVAAPETTTKPVRESEADLATALLEPQGIPSGSSDLSAFQFKVKADSNVTHFSYKVGAPEDCSSGSGYKVESVSSVVSVNVSEMDDGIVAVCLLKFFAPDELWQKAENATVVSWTKIPFERTIKSQFSEFDSSCKKDIVTTTEVKFSGKEGTYTWVRDPKSQGCNQGKTQGEDTMTITSNDGNKITGFWNYNGTEASGWYSFNWKNTERTAFDGDYGYGDPESEPAGPWDSMEF